MTPHVFDDPLALARAAASEVVALARSKPDLLLCAATGNSPLLTYADLVRHHQEDPAIFARLRVVQLDEWVGIPHGSDATCEEYLRRHLIGPLEIAPERFAALRSDVADPEAPCHEMQDWLDRNGPIDVCVLGLGLNGHLGLNEPGASTTAHCHVARLSEATRSHAMIAGLTPPPMLGITLGMADILRARRILLLVSGASKREILRELLETNVTPHLPATALKGHANVGLLVDRAASGA
jgi:galactosamine-6-phosphate isomerase